MRKYRERAQEDRRKFDGLAAVLSAEKSYLAESAKHIRLAEDVFQGLAAVLSAEKSYLAESAKHIRLAEDVFQGHAFEAFKITDLARLQRVAWPPGLGRELTAALGRRFPNVFEADIITKGQVRWMHFRNAFHRLANSYRAFHKELNHDLETYSNALAYSPAMSFAALISEIDRCIALNEEANFEATQAREELLNRSAG